jgi:hypothetical protein
MVVDLTTATLVATAVKCLTEGVTKTFGEETAAGGIKVLQWMQTKLSGRAKEALGDWEKEPSDDNQADLRKQLTKLLDTDPRLRMELQSLVLDCQRRIASASP